MKCNICNSKFLKKFIDLGYQPLANKYPKNKIEIKKEPKYKLDLLFCSNCLNVKIKRLVDRKKMFEEYFYLSSVNLQLVNHFRKLAKVFKKKDFVLDIGSNDGIFLRELKSLGIKHLGVDPSYNVAKIANNKGLKTIVGFFNKKVSDRILKNYGQPNIIVASSIFTHLENPKEFISNIKNLLHIDGTFILEIEYLAKFIKNIEFERFYFDRPYYYSIKSIDILVNSLGMSLVKVEEINPHGGSIRCYIKNKSKLNKDKKTKNLISKEKNQLNLKILEKFKHKINIETKILKNKISYFKKQKKRIIGYGSPARLATITNLCKLNNTDISFVIDDSPLKQNRYTPGMHIPIKKFDEIKKFKPDIIIVFAHEYFSDIKQKTKFIKCKYYKPIPFKILR